MLSSTMSGKEENEGGRVQVADVVVAISASSPSQPWRSRPVPNGGWAVAGPVELLVWWGRSRVGEEVMSVA